MLTKKKFTYLTFHLDSAFTCLPLMVFLEQFDAIDILVARKSALQQRCPGSFDTVVLTLAALDKDTHSPLAESSYFDFGAL